MKQCEQFLKGLLCVVGVLAALSLKAGNFLSKGDVVRPSRVGEQESRVEHDSVPIPGVAPAQQPASELVEKVDPSFAANRSPGLRPTELRFRPTGIKDQYLIEEVDPQGPYGKSFKKGDIVNGEALGLSSGDH
jgi:hypothetical protein